MKCKGIEMFHPNNLQAPNLLDCTLRDGSYAINFQFTSEDTSRLCQSLEAVGVDWIEIGHGVGLCASQRGYGESAETDVAYMKAATSVLTRSKWGMFCIPGIATLEALKEAIDHGVGFIRIGVNLESCAAARPFVELAKKHDLFTCVNFMKSYVRPPQEFAKYAQEAEAYGADLIYLVDSAGGMLPEQVTSYIEAVKERTADLRLGFHGHNNLGLGVINALRAVEMGVEFIDVSLQGLGRSSGNTPSEQFVCALMRKGVDLNIDPVALMDVSERYVRPLQATATADSIDVISGLALFHSSYMGTIQKYALKYRVDPRRLIVAVCEIDRENAPDEMVEAQAARLAQAGAHGAWKALYKNYYGNEQA
jgi:4-hydroxy-2-oxovalerate aldolase